MSQASHLAVSLTRNVVAVINVTSVDVIGCKFCKQPTALEELQRCPCHNCEETRLITINSNTLHKFKCNVMYKNILNFLQKKNICSYNCFVRYVENNISKYTGNLKEKFLEQSFQLLRTKMIGFYRFILNSKIKSDVMCYIEFSSNLCRSIVTFLDYCDRHKYLKYISVKVHVLSITSQILPITQPSKISLVSDSMTIYNKLLLLFSNQINNPNKEPSVTVVLMFIFNNMFRTSTYFKIEEDVKKYYLSHKGKLLRSNISTQLKIQYLYVTIDFYAAVLSKEFNSKKSRCLVADIYIKFVDPLIINYLIDVLKAPGYITLRNQSKVHLECFIHVVLSLTSANTCCWKMLDFNNRILKSEIIPSIEKYLLCSQYVKTTYSHSIVGKGYQILYNLACSIIHLIEKNKDEQNEAKLKEFSSRYMKLISHIPNWSNILFSTDNIPNKENMSSSTILKSILSIKNSMYRKQFLEKILERTGIYIFRTSRYVSRNKAPELRTEATYGVFHHIVLNDDIISFKVIFRYLKNTLPTNDEVCRINGRHFIRYLIEEETKNPRKNKILFFLFHNLCILSQYKTTNKMNILHLLCSLPFVEKYTRIIMEDTDSRRLLQERNHVNLTPMEFAKETKHPSFELTIQSIIYNQDVQSEEDDEGRGPKRQKI